MMEAIVQVVVSGLLGGAVAGVTAVTAVRVRLEWLRRDVDWLILQVERREREQ